MTVRQVVKTVKVNPDPDDFKSAKRGARGLALAGRVSATYVHACEGCGEIQDRDVLRPCCDRVRPMLAVCGPGRLERLKHPAPYPGRQAPPWVNNPVPSRPSGQLPEPSLKDLADLAIRKAYEGLQSGRPAVSVRDVAALLKLQREIERDDAVAAAAEARARAEMFQKGLASTLWTAKRHIDPAKWRAFMDDLRRECESFAPRDTPSPGRR